MGDYSTLERARQAGLLIDVDAPRPEADARCGAYSFELWGQGVDHDPCDLPSGHDDRHYFETH